MRLRKFGFGLLAIIGTVWMFEHPQQFGVALGVLALVAVIALGFFIVRQLVRQARWPMVSGTVLSAQVELKPRKREVDDRDYTDYYEPVVRYRFELDGHSYEGQEFGGVIERGSYRQAEAQFVVDKYPAGASVQVRYNPKNPSESVLYT